MSSAFTLNIFKIDVPSRLNSQWTDISILDILVVQYFDIETETIKYKIHFNERIHAHRLQSKSN